MTDKYFIFTRKDGLVVPSFEIGSLVEKPVISRATRNIKHITVEGRNGTLTEDFKNYNNIEIPFKLINYKENILEKEILRTFDGIGGELKISWLDGSFKIKEVNTFNITENINGIYNIELNFICEPFRYLNEDTIILTTRNTNIFTAGNYETDHITTIYGTGDISLLINDEQIVFKDVTDYITIDTARLICYKDNTPSNNKMLGDFIKLKPYINAIDWIGTVSKIKIKYRGRFLN